MINNVFKFTLLAGLLILSSACKKSPTPAKTPASGTNQLQKISQRIFLKVGDRSIPIEEFHRFRNSFISDGEFDAHMDDSGNTGLLNHFVENQLLITAARKADITISEKDRKNMAAAIGSDDRPEEHVREEEIMAHKYVMLQLSDQVQVSEAELKEYYNKHSGEFISQNVYRVKEILVESETLAKQIHEELLLGGESRFGAFARQFSIAPSASSGGDLGYFRKGELPPEFEKIIFSLKPGMLSSVNRSQYGYHIFYLEEVIRRHAQKFYEVRETILEKIRVEKERTAYDHLIQELCEEYKPKVYINMLDFQPDSGIIIKNILLEDGHAK